MDDGTGTGGNEEGARARREQRVNDLLVLGGDQPFVLADMVVAGQLACSVACFAAVILELFAFVYYSGTSEDGKEHVGGRGGNGGSHPRSEDERAFRAALTEALPEPAMYIDPQ